MRWVQVTTIGVGFIVVVAACGRSAPQETIGDTSEDPEIAGITITSPDAVVSTSSTVAADTTSTTPPDDPNQPQAMYTVKPGDTMSGIAGQYGISIEELADYNGISDVNDLSPGDELGIPPATPVDVTIVSEPPADQAPVQDTLPATDG